MSEKSYEYIITDEVYFILAQKILFAISICLIGVSVMITLFPFQIDMLAFYLILFSIIPLMCLGWVRLQKPNMKVFILNDEKIQVIFPLPDSSTWVQEDVIFEIKWKDFDRIVLSENTISNTEIPDPTIYKVLQFIGVETSEFYYLHRFHPRKQLEISLLLEDWADKMGKEYIEK